uniref:Uncharacterized protein n=1 Tax=Caenorhabditis japonica TaxID=281687 RepID=A0A8R1HNC8_CAEJA
MRFYFLVLTVFLIVCSAQNEGLAKMRELRTNIDPIRSFDLPEDAPRARIISTDFLQRSSKKMKKVFKVRVSISEFFHIYLFHQDDSRQEDFKRWKLDELTDRDMRTSKEVKSSVRVPHGKPKNSESEENIGEFFPSRKFLRL